MFQGHSEVSNQASNQAQLMTDCTTIKNYFLSASFSNLPGFGFPSHGPEPEARVIKLAKILIFSWFKKQAHFI